MSYRMGIQIKNLDKLTNAFNKAPGAYRDIMGKAVTRSVDLIARDARDLAPKKTVYLAGSILPSQPTQSGVQITAKVGTPVKYAPYQEYGTRRGVKPKYYFRRSYQQNTPRVQEIFRSAISDLTKAISA